MAQRATIDPLTGLRGIAVLLVVMNHYFYWCSPYKVDKVPGWIASLFETADLGMTIFFTLSGFVIAYNYFGFGWEQSSFATAARFMYLRFSRLYPALLVFMLVAPTIWLGKFLILFKTAPEPASLWLGLHLLSAEVWLPVKFDGVLPIDDVFFT